MERTNKSNFPESVTPEVKTVLETFIEGILDYQPLTTIEKIVLFGSLTLGTWDHQGSDIDLAVIVEEDSNYAWVNQALGHPTPQQMQLVICGVQRVDPSFIGRLHVHVCLESELKGLMSGCNDGRGPLNKAINAGVTLYRREI